MTYEYPKDPSDPNWPKDKKQAKEMIEEHNKQWIHDRTSRVLNNHSEAYRLGWERIFGVSKGRIGKKIKVWQNS